jgi:antitoxin component HigA of HigAB toxin-antitoxin module
MTTSAQELPEGSARSPVDADENVRQVVALLCAYHGVTRQQLGEAIGIPSKSAMSARMSGKRAFSVNEVAMMAELFGVSVEVFFRGRDALFRQKPRSDPLSRGSITSPTSALPSPVGALNGGPRYAVGLAA